MTVGKAPNDSEIALRFEKELGLVASVWLGIEKRYQLHQMPTAEKRKTGPN